MKDTMIWHCLGGIGDIIRYYRMFIGLIQENKYKNIILSYNTTAIDDISAFTNILLAMYDINVNIKYLKDINVVEYDNENTDIYICGGALLNYKNVWDIDYMKYKRIDKFENLPKRKGRLISLFNSTAVLQEDGFGSDFLSRTKQNCMPIDLIQKIVGKIADEETYYIASTSSEYRLLKKYNIKEEYIIMSQNILNTIYTMCNFDEVYFLSNSAMHHIYGSFIDNGSKVLCYTSEFDRYKYNYEDKDIEYIVYKDINMNIIKGVI